VPGLAFLNFDFVITLRCPIPLSECDPKGNGLRLLSVQAAATG